MQSQIRSEPVQHALAHFDGQRMGARSRATPSCESAIRAPGIESRDDARENVRTLFLSFSIVNRLKFDVNRLSETTRLNPYYCQATRTNSEPENTKLEITL